MVVLSVIVFRPPIALPGALDKDCVAMHIQNYDLSQYSLLDTPSAVVHSQQIYWIADHNLSPRASMLDTSSDGATAGLVLAFLAAVVLTVGVAIKCTQWGPALSRRAQSLSKPNILSLRKKNRSDPPAPSLEV